MDDIGRQTPLRCLGIRPDDYPEIDKNALAEAPPVFRVSPDPETGDRVGTPVAADLVFRHSSGRLYLALATDPDATLSLDSFRTRDGYEAAWAAGIDGDAKTYPTLSGLIGGTLNLKHIRAHSADTLRLAVSIMRPLQISARARAQSYSCVRTQRFGSWESSVAIASLLVWSRRRPVSALARVKAGALSAPPASSGTRPGLPPRRSRRGRPVSDAPRR